MALEISGILICKKYAANSAAATGVPFSQGLQAAHPAKDELRILFVHVDLLVISYQGILPLV